MCRSGQGWRLHASQRAMPARSRAPSPPTLIPHRGFPRGVDGQHPLLCGRDQRRRVGGQQQHGGVGRRLHRVGRSCAHQPHPSVYYRGGWSSGRPGTPITALTLAIKTPPGGWSNGRSPFRPRPCAWGRWGAGQRHPFTFALWDDDLFTYPGQTHMLWQGTGSTYYGTDWGTLLLQGSYQFPTPSPTRTPTSTRTPTRTATPTPTPTRRRGP